MYRSWKLICDKTSFQPELDIETKSRGGEEKKIRTRGMNDEMTGYHRGSPGKAAARSCPECNERTTANQRWPVRLPGGVTGPEMAVVGGDRLH